MTGHLYGCVGGALAHSLQTSDSILVSISVSCLNERHQPFNRTWIWALKSTCVWTTQPPVALGLCINYLLSETVYPVTGVMG